MLQDTFACCVYDIFYQCNPINEQNNKATFPLQTVFDSSYLDELFIYVNNKKRNISTLNDVFIQAKECVRWREREKKQTHRRTLQDQIHLSLRFFSQPVSHSTDGIQHFTAVM